MTTVNVSFNILNEEIVGLDYLQFTKLIEEALSEGFNKKYIDIEINELNRND